MDTSSTVVRETQRKMTSALRLSHTSTKCYCCERTLRQTSMQPIEHSRTQHSTTHGTIYTKTSIDQRIIETSSMETLTAERHPEGLFAPLLRQDWKTALTVILHSPHYTKRVDPMRSDVGLPLNVAILRGAPAEVVTALLEAYPDAATRPTRNKHLPCHFACYNGISSEGMKMLLQCNPDAAGVISDYGKTPMQYLNQRKWQFFPDEKEQVRNDLKQHSSYWKSKEQQDLLQCALEETDRRRSMRRSVARIILGRQFENCDLVALIIEYL
jgi:hypothetical protein